MSIGCRIYAPDFQLVDISILHHCLGLNIVRLCKYTLLLGKQSDQIYWLSWYPILIEILSRMVIVCRDCLGAGKRHVASHPHIRQGYGRTSKFEQDKILSHARFKKKQKQNKKLSSRFQYYNSFGNG